MIILARHGQTEWNKVKRLQGSKNSPLTELGIAQAHNVSTLVSKLVDRQEAVMFSSPLGRALDTAKIIEASLPSVSDMTIEPLLKEYSYGHWEGLTFDDVKAQWPQEWSDRVADKWNYAIPGGEGYSMMSERAKAWLEALSPEHVTVAVSHQMIGRAIRAAYLGLDSERTMALSQNNNEVIVLRDGKETTYTPDTFYLSGCHWVYLSIELPFKRQITKLTSVIAIFPLISHCTH
ncbi:hypothetical protein CS022_19075 [Veronia nyctiphanis]|uniref:Phosphoglycerate mutase n=1 Tax=Veronia nyctiphanis TaxID=1278244 RepID=A0A4Q0YM36_9GAMM|nr:histidine phosphatase family protein [Veronia nyctiphanis]RXJ71870.1 hypothetical protein CS022_19075 [Veronia nyctiphanis]